MSKWSMVLQHVKVKNCCTILLLLLISAGVAKIGRSQSGSPPGAQDIREDRRSMDEYDRTLNRMKNDAKAANERRRNLFPQINEDFQRIQVIHNEMVRMLQPDKNLNYGRLAELTEDMKKRGSRLRENLSLPEPQKDAAKSSNSEPVDESDVKKKIVALHDLILTFVANPLFKNLGVVDANVIKTATENLNHIIDVSDEIKREAKVLSKSSKK